MKRQLCVNFFGGPGVGKTTAASSLFVALKKLNIDTEIVSEFAKDLVLENNRDALQHQWYVIAQQSYRLHCGYRSMQVVICDSPILLGPIYDPDGSRALYSLCLEHHHRFNNFNIVLRRDPNLQFSQAGRVHGLTESISLDYRIIRLLDDNNIPYVETIGWSAQSEWAVLQEIQSHLSGNNV